MVCIVMCFNLKWVYKKGVKIKLNMIFELKLDIVLWDIIPGMGC